MTERTLRVSARMAEEIQQWASDELGQWPRDTAYAADLGNLLSQLTAAASAPDAEAIGALEAKLAEVTAAGTFAQGIEAAARVLEERGSDGWAENVMAEYAAVCCEAIRTLSPTPQADPVREPDYCYDPEEWEYTIQWAYRGEMVESLLDGIPPRKIARVKTLLQGPDKWVARIPIDTDGDGEADDWETMWFDNEASALRSLAQKEPTND